MEGKGMSWERFEGSTLRGSDAAHDIAYAEALEEYERETGRAADASKRRYYSRL